MGYTLFLSPHQPMWLDEVYTYYGVAHDSLGALLKSFSTNFNATPPLYFITIWALSKVFPLSPLSLRLYSTLASGAALCLIWAILRRHTDFVISSVTTLAAFLTSELFLFHNAEARFYGAYIALVAWTTYNYESLCLEAHPSSRRLIWNGISHALAISCTYVAGLYSFAILLSLLIRDRAVGAWRPAVYLSVMAGWLPLILYAPLIWSQRGATRWMPETHVSAALDPVGLGLHPYVLFCSFAGLAAITFLKRYGSQSRDAVISGDRPRVEKRLHLIILGFAFLAVPYVMLIFSLAGVPVLLERYALPSLIGVALLFGGVSTELFWESAHESSKSGASGTIGSGTGLFGRLLAAAMLAALLTFPLWRAASYVRGEITEDKVARYGADDAEGIVATSDAHTYFPRYFYSRESRTIYYVVRDPELQERVATFNLRLNPVTAGVFLAAHDHFRLVSDDPGREWLERDIRRRGDFVITTEERTEKRLVLTVSRK
jgi:hypothetical protein